MGVERTLSKSQHTKLTGEENSPTIDWDENSQPFIMSGALTNKLSVWIWVDGI